MVNSWNYSQAYQRNENLTTNLKGHLFPDLGMEETRSRSWKTLLLAPAAFIATVYNPDKPDIEPPTASKIIPLNWSSEISILIM
jgi:hypothetical protein